MSLKNQEARKLLDLLEAMRGIESVDLSLEKASIVHKIEALLTKQRSEGMHPSELIADMDDDELGWAIATSDPRIGMVSGFAMDPRLFNFLRNNRPRALATSDEIIRKRRR